jgi:hypothetical protein
MFLLNPPSADYILLSTRQSLLSLIAIIQSGRAYYMWSFIIKTVCGLLWM